MINILWFTVGREVDRHLMNVIVSINVATTLIEKFMTARLFCFFTIVCSLLLERIGFVPRGTPPSVFFITRLTNSAPPIFRPLHKKKEILVIIIKNVYRFERFWRVFLVVGCWEKIESGIVVRLRRQFDKVHGRLALLLAGRDLRPFVANPSIETEALPQHGVVGQSGNARRQQTTSDYHQQNW